jgi:hypothetical protein
MFEGAAHTTREIPMLGWLKQCRDDDRQVAQAEFVERIAEAAAIFTGAAADHAYELDFSQASLGAVDDLLQRAHEGSLHLDAVQAMGAAAYIYEVARLNYGGQYEVCDNDDPVVLVTGSPHFEVCLCAMSRVERRLRVGPDASIPVFFDAYVQRVAARASVIVR